MIDLSNLQDTLNNKLGNLNLDALAGLTPDAIANLGNLNLDDIQAKLNLPDIANVEDIIANIKDKVPDVADALDQLANLKDALANLVDGLDVANLQEVQAANLQSTA